MFHHPPHSTPSKGSFTNLHPRFPGAPAKHIFAGSPFENFRHPQHWLKVRTPCAPQYFLQSSSAFSVGIGAPSCIGMHTQPPFKLFAFLSTSTLLWFAPARGGSMWDNNCSAVQGLTVPFELILHRLCRCAHGHLPCLLLKHGPDLRDPLHGRQVAYITAIAENIRKFPNYFCQ